MSDSDSTTTSIPVAPERGLRCAEALAGTRLPLLWGAS